MAAWAIVVDGEIIEYHNFVPRNWHNISNFANAQEDLEFMASQDWYPVRYASVEFDQYTQEIADYIHEFTGDSVVLTPVIQDKPPPVPSDDPPMPILDPTTPQPVSAPAHLDAPTLEFLRGLRQQLDQCMLAIQQNIEENVGPDVMQQDSQWRQSLREKLEDRLLNHQISYISRDLAKDQDLQERVAQAVAPMLTLDAITNKNNPVAQILIDQQLMTEPLDLQGLNHEVRRLIDQQNGLLYREYNRIVMAHRDYIQGLINLEEIGVDQPRDQLDQVRLQRNKLLQKSDYTQLSDVQASMNPQLQQQWQEYRQALRDMPQTLINTGEIQWPETP